MVALVLGFALLGTACADRTGEAERELLVPAWLQGTWTSEGHNGDQTTLHRFEFLDGGGVVHSLERCMDSDNGESLPSHFASESPDASWAWGPGDSIEVLGLVDGSWSSVDHGVVRRRPDDCRALDFELILPSSPSPVTMAPLGFADLCFTTPQCWAQVVIECSPTPDGCPG